MLPGPEEMAKVIGNDWKSKCKTDVTHDLIKRINRGETDVAWFALGVVVSCLERGTTIPQPMSGWLVKAFSDPDMKSDPAKLGRLLGLKRPNAVGLKRPKAGRSALEHAESNPKIVALVAAIHDKFKLPLRLGSSPNAFEAASAVLSLPENKRPIGAAGVRKIWLARPKS